MLHPRLHLFCRNSASCSASMETCRAARTVSSIWGLAISPKDLWCLLFRVLSKLMGLPPCLLKKFLKDEHVHPPVMELETSGGMLPELPLDTLMIIFANLEIPDLVRAGSVCSSWHAAQKLGQYKKFQTPCLFYTPKSASENVACIYSLVEHKVYKLTLPEPPIRSRFVIGSSNGWLITADERSELHLVNPITGEQISLPSVITIEQVKPIFDDSGTIHKYELSYYTGEEVYREFPEIHAINELRDYFCFKAFVFPDPSTGRYIVVLIYNPYCQLSFARAGDDRWTWLPPNAGYRDCAYLDGLLYALTSVGEIDAFDLTGATVTRKVIMNKVKNYIYESMYIIPAPWGDLLQVWRIVNHPNFVVRDEDGDALETMNVLEQEDEDDDAPEIVNAPESVPYITKRIRIYKVDMAAKKLVKINSLPHHILFLGHNQSLCLPAEQHPQLKANHAYFTDDHDELIMLMKDDTRDIGVLNLKNHRKKEIVPQIWSNWPCPTWIIPNLTSMNLAFSK
ncbi:hypothetical protein ACP70R_003136 [Stipagrostis hirtigluma subsp. patula]